MKIRILIIILLIISFKSLGQCPTTNIILNSQEDIDDFAINYPGCTQILNGLSIHGNDIANFDGLTNISTITGDLFLDDNNILTSLEGLINLTTINGNLLINGNNILDYLTGLDNLTIINGNVEIISTGLTNCTGLGSLTTITGDFKTSSTHSFVGLNSLQIIGGTLNLQSNSQLSSLNGLYV